MCRPTHHTSSLEGCCDIPNGLVQLRHGAHYLSHDVATRVVDEALAEFLRSWYDKYRKNGSCSFAFSLMIEMARSVNKGVEKVLLPPPAGR